MQRTDMVSKQLTAAFEREPHVKFQMENHRITLAASGGDQGRKMGRNRTAGVRMLSASSIVSRCGPDLTAGPRREMSARKILSDLAAAIARKGLGPANTTRPRHRPRTMPENTNSQRPQPLILRTAQPSSFTQSEDDDARIVEPDA
jgi:hypothetical protein